MSADITIFKLTSKANRLIRSGAAQPFTARADSPTVTMPRIKAIITGSVPSFSDIVLNVAESDSTSSLAHQDNLLTQLKMGLGKRMVMYGDDTWLRLFPGTFDRFDGTTSFFVSVSGVHTMILWEFSSLKWIQFVPGLCRSRQQCNSPFARRTCER